MQVQKILFATDYSHLSDAALSFATMFAREAGGRLVIVHVQEPPLAYGGGEMYYGVAEPATDELLKMLYAVKPTDPNIPYEHRLLRGDIADAVSQLAREEHCDLIVIGSHGRTGLTRVLMGSVAEAIVRKAPCPVLVFKQPLKKERAATENVAANPQLAKAGEVAL